MFKGVAEDATGDALQQEVLVHHRSNLCLFVLDSTLIDFVLLFFSSDQDARNCIVAMNVLWPNSLVFEHACVITC